MLPVVPVRRPRPAPTVAKRQGWFKDNSVHSSAVSGVGQRGQQNREQEQLPARKVRLGFCVGELVLARLA